MEKLELTWARALYLWFGIFWRWAIGVLLLTLVLVVFNEVTIRIYGWDLFADLAAMRAVMILWLVIAFVAFRMTLRASNRNFHIVLVSNRSQTPACGGTVLPSQDSAAAALHRVDHGPVS